MEARKVADRAHDVIIVGAGFAGLYALHRLRGQGLDAAIVEAASGVGGTWYWNRYPGARVDIDSMEYSYSFSEELQQEWQWSERYASQAELLVYLNHVADRFDLRRSIRFDTRIAGAQFDADDNLWHLTSEAGEAFAARYCVMATGFLSAPNQPDFPGLESFTGKQYHTAYWPHEGVDFSGDRVAVIGTGSSAVQSIPIIAEQAEHLTVFQRTPPYSVPLRNCPMPPDYEARVKSQYAEWRRREREDSFLGAISCNFHPEPQVMTMAMDATEEERNALYGNRWQSGGLAFYNVYPDVFSNRRANDTLADYLRARIRERIEDSAVADLLVPTRYPVLTKRLCADTGYFETYNRANVSLVDINGGSIALTPRGVSVKAQDYEVDAIVFATGFDALTGALTRIDIKGVDGRSLNDHWREGARTAFGLMAAGFPNLFLLDGPGSPCPLFQPILLSEEQVDWIGDWITDLDGKGISRIEPSAEVEQAWVDHCTAAVNATLFLDTASWYVGGNIPGKTPTGLVDFGGMLNYRARCSEILPQGFPGFILGDAPRQDGTPERVTLGIVTGAQHAAS